MDLNMDTKESIMEMATADKIFLQLKTYRIEWTIERFFACCKNVGDSHITPALPIDYPEGSTWKLQIYPRGNSKKSENYVSLFIHFENESVSQVTVDHKCTIRGNPSDLTAEYKSTTFKDSSSIWNRCRFSSQDDIRKNGAIIDDTLKILFEITFYPVNENHTKNLYSEHLTKTASGLDDYEKIFENDSFTDVTFNIQKHEIRLHKVILSCRSSVFKAMFENDMKEKRQSTVNIEDIDFEVMKELFRFIYTGKVENIKKVAMDLLIAADKYAVTQLKALCEKMLYDNVTIDNVVKYLKLADMCDTLHLKQLLIKFIVDNLQDITGMTDFYSVFAELNPKVPCEILKAIAEKK